jgi:hypothetical protein
VSFTRQEYTSIMQAGYDHGRGVREYLGNPEVDGIWRELGPAEREDFTNLVVLAMVLRLLKHDCRRREDYERREEQRAKRRAAYAARAARKKEPAR